MRATLLATFLEIVGPWRHVFPQQRTWRRAVRQALGSLVCLGRRCLSRIIWTNGGQGRSWSAGYFLHSRCHWQPPALFQPIWDRALPLCRGRLVGVAVDDTRLPKTGRCIVQAAYHRDPLSPPFHVNLIRAVRFLQASLLVPMHRRAPRYTRALPVRFDEVSYVKKPSRRATAEAWAQYKAAVTLHKLSRHFVTMAQAIRQTVDRAGGARKTVVLAGDSSFCNRTCLRAVLDRTELIVRTRKDAVLCHRAAPGGRRFYAPTTFTPDELRHDAARRLLDIRHLVEAYRQGARIPRGASVHRHEQRGLQKAHGADQVDMERRRQRVAVIGRLHDTAPGFRQPGIINRHAHQAPATQRQRAVPDRLKQRRGRPVTPGVEKVLRAPTATLSAIGPDNARQTAPAQTDQRAERLADGASPRPLLREDVAPGPHDLEERGQQRRPHRPSDRRPNVFFSVRTKRSPRATFFVNEETRLSRSTGTPNRVSMRLRISEPCSGARALLSMAKAMSTCDRPVARCARAVVGAPP